MKNRCAGRRGLHLYLAAASGTVKFPVYHPILVRSQVALLDLLWITVIDQGIELEVLIGTAIEMTAIAADRVFIALIVLHNLYIRGQSQDVSYRFCVQFGQISLGKLLLKFELLSKTIGERAHLIQKIKHGLRKISFFPFLHQPGNKLL